MIKYRASKLTIKLVPQNIEKAFLNENHKQGYIKSEYAIGLFNNDKLLQIETFGPPRIEIQNKNIIHDWELLRECSKKDCIIYGGKSRLLKHFFAETKCLFLLSYCSLTEGFDGHSYKACGFNLVTVNESYHYEYNGDIIQRYSMQKNANLRRQGLKEPIQKTLERYGKTYDPNKTEKENAAVAGFKLVKDIGNQTWEYLNADNIGYIYIIENKVNGKRYIGQHTLVKEGVVKNRNYFGSGVALNKAVAKYGKKAFSRKVLEWTTDLSKLTELEYRYINELKPEYNESLSPFNAAAHTTNSRNRGQKHSDEWNLKIAKALKEKKKSEEHKEALSAAQQARWVKCHQERPVTEKSFISEDKGQLKTDTIKKQHKGKASILGEKNPNYGKHCSEENKRKLSEANAKTRESIIEEIHRMGYKTREDVMKELGLTIKQVIRRYKPRGKYKGYLYY